MTAVLTTTILLTGCGENSKSAQTTSKQDLTTVRLGVMTGNSDSWLATIGQAQGIYEKNGLDVQITEFAAGINTVDAITTNQLDIGFTADFAGVNRIGSTQEKTDLRYFAGISYASGSELYVNPNVIKSTSDLKGAKIITLLGTVWEYFNASVLTYAGFGARDYEQIVVDSMQDGLALCSKGDADAFFTSGENAARLKEYGWTQLIGQDDLGTETYCLYMASDEYLRNNKDTVIKFIKATQEIMDYIGSNTDAAADIMKEKAGLEQSVFKNQVAAIQYDLKIDQTEYDALQNVADWTQQNGYYENPINIGDYLNTDALAEAFPDKVAYQAK